MNLTISQQEVVELLKSGAVLKRSRFGSWVAIKDGRESKIHSKTAIGLLNRRIIQSVVSSFDSTLFDLIPISS